jgi:hypothetical protein
MRGYNGQSPTLQTVASTGWIRTSNRTIATYNDINKN